MKTVRCAIYTRKSSDEGLEQSFNSLDAQREACSAYILSQASEGWSEVREHYDDGGLSGGTLERPALQRLLGDIAAGRIDIVVVYKVDRLTRSLLDFAKLVEAFDKAGTSFVSITQSFNTTSSMGRLTLNMLLSFAQFEREVTAERIRDKIAASKAKGMWMGGIPPLGYKPDGRSLAVVEEHAALVRTIFQRYVELGTVRRLAEALDSEGMHAPPRSTATGKAIGGRPFSRGQLYLMLNCRTYLGEVKHGDNVYPGLHQPIIARELWNEVQDRLASHVQGQRSIRTPQASLLAGKIVDGSGEPLIAVHACKPGSKGRTRYRYYVSQALHHGQTEQGMRIPAREIEALVAEQVAQAFDDPLALVAKAGLDLQVERISHIDPRAKEVAAAIRQKRRETFASLIGRVVIGEQQVAITVPSGAAADMLGLASDRAGTADIELVAHVRVKRSGMAMRLVQDAGVAATATPDQSLIRSVLRARRSWAELKLGHINVTALAQREGCSGSYVTRMLRLAFLSPAVVEAVLKGEQRAGVDARMLTLGGELAADWKLQEQALLRR